MHHLNQEYVLQKFSYLFSDGLPTIVFRGHFKRLEISFLGENKGRLLWEGYGVSGLPKLRRKLWTDAEFFIVKSARSGFVFSGICHAAVRSDFVFQSHSPVGGVDDESS